MYFIEIKSNINLQGGLITPLRLSLETALHNIIQGIKNVREFVMKEYPTQERLKELFDYREDGHLIWKISPSNNVKIGDVAGSISKSTGYRDVRVDNKLYRSHRLIFIFRKGFNPENDIDHHPDRTRSNNRIENLREATRSCNLRNSVIRNDNTSGVKGVCWYKSRNKWLVQIWVMGEKKYLGDHKDFDEAVLHRLAAEQCIGWEGCDSLSPAYQYAIKNKLIKR